MAPVERLTLRILPRDMSENLAISTHRSVQNHGNMRDPQRGRRRDEIDERILLHEVVKEFAILHQMRLGNVQARIDFCRLLR
jgi:hypothetical protein